MGAPDKIYLCPSDRPNQEYDDDWFYNPQSEGCVEYTRTDAFIEKTWNVRLMNKSYSLLKNMANVFQKKKIA